MQMRVVAGSFAAGLLLAGCMEYAERVATGTNASGTPREQNMDGESFSRATWPIGFGQFADAVAESAVCLRASSDRPGEYRLTPRFAGSVRLVGCLRKTSTDRDADIQVRAEGATIWRRKLSCEDTIPHAFDVLAYDLTEESAIDVCVTAGPGALPVQVDVALQIVPEPFVSRWKPDLATGYPSWTEEEKEGLRTKGQEILQAIRDAAAAGHVRLVIPPGDYLFPARWSQASTLTGLGDIEIVADGVTFWFEPPMIHGLLFENCRNVTVRGLTIDFTIPCWFQARVVDIDREGKGIRAELMAGYEPRTAEAEKERSGARTFIFYDADGRFINHGPSPGKWELSADEAGVLCRDIQRWGIPGALQPGGYIVGTIRTGAALRSRDCAFMRFEGVNVWSSPGMAVWEGGGEGGNVYRHVRATRRPFTSRLHAFGADVFHLAGADRGPTLERCEMAYAADDTLNIHGSFGRVVEKVDSRRYYLEGAYDVGDTIEFRDMGSVNLLGVTNVISAHRTPDGPSLAINEKFSAKGEFLVELDTPLDLPALSLVVLDGKRSAAGFILRDCWLHDDFQRTLINGSPGGLIENNTLQNVGMGICIQFETWGPWMEGPFARDLTIRNNRFLDSPPQGPAISVSMHPPGGGSNRRRFDAKPVKNMSIAGNYFARTKSAPISIHNVDRLKIHGNSIDRPSDGTESARPDWVHLQDCVNVSIENNHTSRMGKSRP